MARGRGGRRLASLDYKCERGVEPPVHLPFILLPIASFLSILLPWRRRRGSQRPRKGRPPMRGQPPLPKRGRGHPRKHPVVPPAAPRGSGRAPPKGSVAPGVRDGTSSRGGGHRLWSSPHDEGRRAMVVRPPRPHFSSLEVLPEFEVWLENPASTSLRLPRFSSGELPSSGPVGL